MRQHSYQTTVTWTGNRGTGTSAYQAYDRDHTVIAAGPPPLLGSSGSEFRGDPTRWNPEQLLVAAIAQCHMLWYLHLCAEQHVVVTSYTDTAAGLMVAESGGGGAFREVVLRPEVEVTHPEMCEAATNLHAEAHRRCYIANSVNFPVRHEPAVKVSPSP